LASMCKSCLWVEVSLLVSNPVPLQALHQPNAAINVMSQNASEVMLQRCMNSWSLRNYL